MADQCPELFFLGDRIRAYAVTPQRDEALSGFRIRDLLEIATQVDIDADRATAAALSHLRGKYLHGIEERARMREEAAAKGRGEGLAAELVERLRRERDAAIWEADRLRVELTRQQRKAADLAERVRTAEHFEQAAEALCGAIFTKREARRAAGHPLRSPGSERVGGE